MLLCCAVLCPARFVAQLDAAILRVQGVLPGLYNLALGGSAVGTGMNTEHGYDVKVAHAIQVKTGASP